MEMNVLRPLRQLIDWIDGLMRKRYENRQTSDLIQIQREQTLLLARAQERERTPSFSVAVQFRRDTISSKPHVKSAIIFCVENSGGETNLLDSAIRMVFPQREAYNQEKKIPKTKFPKGKYEDFFEPSIFIHQEIISGRAEVEFLYELLFEGVNKEPIKQKGRARYNSKNEQFEWL